MANQVPRANNVKQYDGVSFENLYGMDLSNLTNANRTNFFVEVKVHPDGSTHAVCLYTGSVALTAAELIALPVGSIVYCPAVSGGALILLKINSSNTWKSAAVAGSVS